MFNFTHRASASIFHDKHTLARDAILRPGRRVDRLIRLHHATGRRGRRRGIDVAAIMAVAHGVRSIETIREVAPHLDAEAEAARLLALEVADTDGVIAMPGAHSLLASLPDGAWTIVTSGNRELPRRGWRPSGCPFPRRWSRPTT